MSTFLGIATKKMFCYGLLITLICVSCVKSGKSWFSSSKTKAATKNDETCNIYSLQDYQKFIRELPTHLKKESLKISFFRFKTLSEFFLFINIPCKKCKGK